ncbi:DUF1285 domain-containing protein [Amaricoccus macauensis]|uniref:DUF1285 domain-containing protein n=1 Tax=Amaricoccus macauensis TaxID=57001 RepID=UPI003C7B11CE
MHKGDHETDTNVGVGTVSTADSIATHIQKAAKGRGPAPVHLWNPPFCGDLDMRIARDGTWFYLGTPIGRMPLVKLFSSVLKKEDGKYFLVTPVEKVGIRVEDAPFVAVDFQVHGEGRDQEITFLTNVDEEAVAGRDHPIRVVRDAETGEPSPYVMIRSGLEALIDRKSFYRLVEICCEEEIDGTSQFGLWSGGVFWPFIPAKELA